MTEKIIPYSATVRRVLNKIFSESSFKWPDFLDYAKKQLPPMSDKQFNIYLAGYWDDPLAKWHW